MADDHGAFEYIRVLLYVELIAFGLGWLALLVWTLVVEAYGELLGVAVVSVHAVGAFAALEAMSFYDEARRQKRPRRPLKHWEIIRWVAQAAVTLVGDVVILLGAILVTYPHAVDAGHSNYGVYGIVYFAFLLASSVGFTIALLVIWGTRGTQPVDIPAARKAPRTVASYSAYNNV